MSCLPFVSIPLTAGISDVSAFCICLSNTVVQKKVDMNAPQKMIPV